MKLIGLLATGALFLPSIASAVCAIEPLAPQVRSAQVVYVGTVTASVLAEPLGKANADTGQGVKVVHTLIPQIVFKGDPAQVSSIVSTWEYNDPRSKYRVELSELHPIVPGDTLLVVGNVGESVRVDTCSPSRPWSPETAQVVRAAFPSAP